VLELRDRTLRSDTPFKAQNYEKAIRSIDAHPTPIRSGEEAMALPGVGPKTAEKIQEIIETVYLLKFR
jgi:DNA polymerase lambda